MNDKKIKPYNQTLFRISENYLMPDQKVGGLPREKFEKALADSGVDARWVGVYHHGGPRFKSQFVPMSKSVPRDLTVELKKWVDIVHKAGMNAITWSGIAHCESGWAKHPEWRAVSIDGAYHDRASCCINTSYGDAFIGMVGEYFDKFGLDGIYFDGAAFATFPIRKIPTCACTGCQKKFLADTGYRLPKKVNFSDKVFRIWVKWRFKMYAAYLKKLVDTIHIHYPHKVITINHYHRYSSHAWHTACPLDLFDCGDIVTGSEAMQHMDYASFSSKMARAYGRSVDVWTPVARWRMGVDWQFHEPNALIHHAAICHTFGAYPSFGFETDIPQGSLPASMKSALKPLAEFLHRRAPYVELESANPVALHLSQQTETFFFGRHSGEPSFCWYWQSLMGWDQLLNETGLGADIIFDKHINLEWLSRYKIVILPLSLALSDKQGDILKAYVARGGVLVLGPWAGRLDEDGEPVNNRVMAELRSIYEHGALPAVDKFSRSSMYLRNQKAPCADIHGFAVYTMMAAQKSKKEAQVLMDIDATPVVTKKRCGQGYVIDLAADWGASFYYAPSSPMRRMLKTILCSTGNLHVVVNAPACVSVALRREKEGAYLLHLHNCPTTFHHQGYQSEEYYMPILPRDIIPVCDVEIAVRQLKLKQAERLIEKPGVLSMQRRAGGAILRLDRLALHEIVRLSFGT